MKLYLRATGCHTCHGITHCYLPHDTSEHTPPNSSQTGRYSIYLYPGPEGWKAELTVKFNSAFHPSGVCKLPMWLITYRDGLPAHRRSSVKGLT